MSPKIILEQLAEALRDFRRKVQAERCARAGRHTPRVIPVILEARGTGARDLYRVEGWGRYYCARCKRELGTGEIAAIVPAKLSLEVPDLPEVLGPAIGHPLDLLELEDDELAAEGGLG